MPCWFFQPGEHSAGRPVEKALENVSGETRIRSGSFDLSNCRPETTLTKIPDTSGMISSRVEDKNRRESANLSLACRSASPIRYFTMNSGDLRSS